MDLLHPYGPPGRAVLHVDVDAFFCQVEQLRRPELSGRIIAIRQHGDTISVGYKARKAGVKKHMLPAKAAEILAGVGGVLAHVFQEPDGRVSYRPYREASGALMRLLKAGGGRTAHGSCFGVGGAALLAVEKASIDEAYLALQLQGQGEAGGAGAKVATAAGLPPLSDLAAWVPAAAAAGLRWELSAAAAVAAALRAGVKASLGLTVSVGVAPNKLLAKLASRAAKPDGVVVLDSVAAVQQLLQATGVERLPGLGGAVAVALGRHGITNIAQLQRHSAAQLSSMLGLTLQPAGPPGTAAVAGTAAAAGHGATHSNDKLAARLVQCGWGCDDAAVEDRGPPKSIQVQVSLTPTRVEACEAPPGAALQLGVDRYIDKAGGRWLCAGSSDGLTLLTRLLGHMTDDLLGRVVLDRHSEDRWPRKLALSLTSLTPRPPRTAKAATRSCAFPTPALLSQQHQQQVTPAAAAASSEAAAAVGAACPLAGVLGERSFAVEPALTAAVRGLAVGLAQALLAPLAPSQIVFQVNLAASGFSSYDSAAAAGSIMRFTAPLTRPGQAQPAAAAAAGGRQQQPPQQSEAGEAAEEGAAGAVEAGRAESPMEVEQAEQQQQPAAPQHQQHQQVQERQRLGSHLALAAAEPAAAAVGSPPVLLSAVLSRLARGGAAGVSAAVAEAELQQLLASTGRQRLLG